MGSFAGLGVNDGACREVPGRGGERRLATVLGRPVITGSPWVPGYRAKVPLDTVGGCLGHVPGAPRRMASGVGVGHQGLVKLPSIPLKTSRNQNYWVALSSVRPHCSRHCQRWPNARRTGRSYTDLQPKHGLRTFPTQAPARGYSGGIRFVWGSIPLQSLCSRAGWSYSERAA